jgi:hypothetical protein
MSLQHLKDQFKLDGDVKDLSSQLPLFFTQAKDVQDTPGTAERLLDLLRGNEELFRDCVNFILEYCTAPVAGEHIRRSHLGPDRR